MAVVKAILRASIKNYGDTGDIVSVPRGYFVYLASQGKACYATKEAIDNLEHEKALLQQQDEERKAQAEQWIVSWGDQVLVIDDKAGEQGILYGSVSARDIAQKLTKPEMVIRTSQVLLDRPLKEVGHYTLRIDLHPHVQAMIPVEIRAAQDNHALER